MDRTKEQESKPFRSLRSTLATSFLVLSSVVILITSLLNIYGEYQNQRTVLASRQKLIAKTAANEVSNFVTKRFRILESTVQIGNLLSLSKGKLQLILEKLIGLESAFRQIAILDTLGREQIRVSRVSRLTSGQLIGQSKKELLSHSKKSMAYVSSVYIENVSSEPLVMMAVPIFNVFGDFKGILTAELNLKFMWDLVGSLKVGKTGWAYVVDRRGDLIAFGDVGRVLARENLLRIPEVSAFVNNRQWKVEKTKSKISKGINGKYVVSSHFPLNMPDWAVIVELPALEAYHSTLTSFGIAGIILLLGLAFAMVISVYLAKKITGPIIALRNAAKTISDDNLNTKLLIQSPNEIGELAKSFNAMIARLHETTVSKDWFEVMVGSIGDAVIAADVNSIVTFMNKEAEKLTGWKNDEVHHQKEISAIVNILNEKTRAKAEIPVERVIREGVVVGLANDTLLVRRDGAEFPIDDIGAPIRNNKGEIIGAVLVFRDITQRKSMEKKKTQLELQLRSAQKLEAIGQLAAGIAHEINTPAQFVGDNVHFLRASFGEVLDFLKKSAALVEEKKDNRLTEVLFSEVRGAYEKIDLDYFCEEIPNAISQSIDGNKRISEIVQAMKEFSHSGGKEKTVIDLNRAIETTVIVARSEWKYVAEMETKLDLTLPHVPCLPGEINQVLLNLIVNAAHAIEEKYGGQDKGKIRIETRKDGEWMEIRVEDTGKGIPKDVEDRIFEPFFTTKEMGKGSGQGLAISRSMIVDKHQGTLHFETIVGEGTAFIIRLPLKDGEI